MTTLLSRGALPILMAMQVACGALGWSDHGGRTLSRGLRQAEEKRYDAAIQTFRGALFTEARHAAYNNIGVAYARLGDYRRALLEYDRVPPESRTAVLQYNRGVALLRLERYAEAVDALRVAVAEYPRFLRAWNNLGLALLGQSRLREAEEALRRALALRSDSPRLWNNLGAAHARAGRIDAAVRAFRAALRLDSRYEVARRNLARLERRVALRR